MHPIVQELQAWYEGLSVTEQYSKFSALYTSKYDRNPEHWIPELQPRFPDCFIEDLTDHNYNKCFTYLINLTGTKMGWYWQKEYLREHGCNDWVEIQLSMIAPYAMFKFVRYRLKDDGEKYDFDISDVPHLEEHKVFEEAALVFLADHKFQRLDDETMKLPVLGVKLELQEDTPSVYNCLFEDSASYYSW